MNVKVGCNTYTIKTNCNKGTGVTTAVLTHVESGVSKTGIARCSLKEPSWFIPSKGKKIALARAMSQMGLSKTDRQWIWCDYLWQAEKRIV